MKAKLLVALPLAALIFGAGWFVGHKPATKPEDTPQPQPPANSPVMPQPRALDPIWRTPTMSSKKTIPLSEVYASVDQDELKFAPFSRDEETLEEWKSLKAIVVKQGRPTMFIVRAFTIHGAISQTLDTFVNRRAITRLTPPQPHEARELWAFVYLGNGLNSPYWNIDSIVVNRSEAELRYSPALRTLNIGSIFPHCYWFSLGKNHSNTITLRLIDNEDGCEVLKTSTRLIPSKN